MSSKISNEQSLEPELTETFLVKLLGLELFPDILIAGGPRQDLNSMIAVVMTRVFIGEHGNPRGIVQFHVERVSCHNKNLSKFSFNNIIINNRNDNKLIFVSLYE